MSKTILVVDDVFHVHAILPFIKFLNPSETFRDLIFNKNKRETEKCSLTTRSLSPEAGSTDFVTDDDVGRSTKSI